MYKFTIIKQFPNRPQNSSYYSVNSNEEANEILNRECLDPYFIRVNVH